MKLQEQVCTLEQAKRLKELGCEQNAQICYIDENGLWGLHNYHPLIHIEWDWYSAYTVAELGEMLVKLGETEIDTYYENGQWTMAKGIETIPSLVRYIWHPTEAQARAALLIHILEQEKEHDT